jgi:hypothetical protein
MNIRKYSAMAIVGAGLAFAAASPASACGAFGMVGMPVFGAAFGGCGGYGFAAPAPVAFGWGGGCAPVAFGCGGGYGAAYGYARPVFARPVFGWARPIFARPVYGWARPSYGYGGGYGAYGSAYGGCRHHIARRGYGYGYATAWRRPAGFAVAFHRPVRVFAAFHRPLRTFAAFRSYRPSRFASVRTHHRNLYASYGMRRHYAMSVRYGRA